MHQISILTPHTCINYQFWRHMYSSATNSYATYMHQLSILTPHICISYKFWRQIYVSAINSDATYMHHIADATYMRQLLILTPHTHQLSILASHICINYQSWRLIYASAINYGATYIHQLSILTRHICISN